MHLHIFVQSEARQGQVQFHNSIATALSVVIYIRPQSPHMAKRYMTIPAHAVETDPAMIMIKTKTNERARLCGINVNALPKRDMQNGN